jgi:hypothetical protein
MRHRLLGTLAAVTSTGLLAAGRAGKSMPAGTEDVYLGDPVEAATAAAHGGAQVKCLAPTAQASNYEVVLRRFAGMDQVTGRRANQP